MTDKLEVFSYNDLLQEVCRLNLFEYAELKRVLVNPGIEVRKKLLWRILTKYNRAMSVKPNITWQNLIVSDEIISLLRPKDSVLLVSRSEYSNAKKIASFCDSLIEIVQVQSVTEVTSSNHQMQPGPFNLEFINAMKPVDVLLIEDSFFSEVLLYSNLLLAALTKKVKRLLVLQVSVKANSVFNKPDRTRYNPLQNVFHDVLDEDKVRKCIHSFGFNRVFTLESSPIKKETRYTEAAALEVSFHEEAKNNFSDTDIILQTLISTKHV